MKKFIFKFRFAIYGAFVGAILQALSTLTIFHTLPILFPVFIFISLIVAFKLDDKYVLNK